MLYFAKYHVTGICIARVMRRVGSPSFFFSATTSITHLSEELPGYRPVSAAAISPRGRTSATDVRLSVLSTHTATSVAGWRLLFLFLSFSLFLMLPFFFCLFFPPLFPPLPSLFLYEDPILACLLGTSMHYLGFQCFYLNNQQHTEHARINR